MKFRSQILIILLGLFAAEPTLSMADSAKLVGRQVFVSANGRWCLTVDPGTEKIGEPGKAILILDDDTKGRIWTRQPSDFEDFRFPMHACVSNDGAWIVFGGYSAHNVSFDPEYKGGLRFYDTAGALVRFVSRLDLPRGHDGISTSGWYDESRSRIENRRFIFYTPGLPEPLEFDLESGALLKGKLIPGQGDDKNSKLFERLRQRADQ